LNIRLDVGQGLPGPKRPVGAFRGFRHSFHVGALVFQVADLISRDRCSSSADRREDGSDKARKLLGWHRPRTNPGHHVRIERAQSGSLLAAAVAIMGGAPDPAPDALGCVPRQFNTDGKKKTPEL
jgi:hypothetical protein